MLIDEGHALLTTVRYSVRFPWDRQQRLVEEQMFKRADLGPAIARKETT